MFDIRKIAVVVFLLMVAACSGPQPATEDEAASEAQEVFVDDFESSEDEEWTESNTEPQPDGENQESNEGDKASGE